MITIVFAGLIAHVLTSGGVQRAVVVAAPEHAARLVVNVADVLDIQGIPEVASPVDGERVFDISGQHLALDGGTHAPTIRTDTLRNHVVSLSAVSDATALRDEVERGELFSGVSAYLDLDGGVLDADEQSVKREVVFHAEGIRDITFCAFLGARYTTTVSGPTVTLRGSDGAILQLRQGSTVRVNNVPPPDYKDPHFHMCAVILKDSSYIGTPALTGRMCDGGKTEERRGPGRIQSDAVVTPLTFGAPDCTITQWP